MLDPDHVIVTPVLLLRLEETVNLVVTLHEVGHRGVVLGTELFGLAKGHGAPVVHEASVANQSPASLTRATQETASNKLPCNKESLIQKYKISLQLNEKCENSCQTQIRA